MKISIITVVFNGEETIADCLNSVAMQAYGDVEHIVIDGGSSDGTGEIVERHISSVAQFISEPDEGIYDAMNKGISLATGEVIGILNSDDIYQDQTILAQVASAFESNDIDACYADLVYVKQDNLDHVVRNWQSQDHFSGLSFRGWMPAHPTLFITKSAYQRVGDYDTKLRFQADLEFCARAFERFKIRSQYIPALWVRMRLGGASNNSLINMLKGNWESYLALRRLGMKRDPFSYFFIKFSSRIKQFV